MMPFDLSCCVCGSAFTSASQLLKHFADHVQEPLKNGSLEITQKWQLKNNTTKIPDLYPIRKNKTSELPLNASVKTMLQKIAQEEDTVDSGIEDFVNPINYCEVTISEAEEKIKSGSGEKKCENGKSGQKIKKYSCSYCQKQFGWSIDLKRHTLIHTGEKPFKCSNCPSKFTRKFLLQKHQLRIHKNDKFLMNKNKKNLPFLSPLMLLRKKQ